MLIFRRSWRESEKETELRRRNVDREKFKRFKPSNRMFKNLQVTYSHFSSFLTLLIRKERGAEEPEIRAERAIEAAGDEDQRKSPTKVC